MKKQQYIWMAVAHMIYVVYLVGFLLLQLLLFVDLFVQWFLLLLLRDFIRSYSDTVSG